MFVVNSPEARLAEMFAAWLLALYGVWRRDWPGTITCVAGLSLAAGKMFIRETPILVCPVDLKGPR